MEYHGMTLSQALDHVQHCRPQIQPNAGFWRQLQTYEQWIQRRPPRERSPDDDARSPSCPVEEETDPNQMLLHVWSRFRNWSIPMMIRKPPSTTNSTSTTSRMALDPDWIRQSTALFACGRDLDWPPHAFRQACFGPLLDYLVPASCRGVDTLGNSGHEEEEDPWGSQHEWIPPTTSFVVVPRSDVGTLFPTITVDALLTDVLDYIWGRGVLVVECEWLAQLCWCLDRRFRGSSSTRSTPTPTNHKDDDDDNKDHETEHSPGKDDTDDPPKECSTVSSSSSSSWTMSASSRVSVLLTNPESAFGQQWTGEIYPPQLGRVFTAMEQLEDEDEEEEETEKTNRS